MKTSIFDVIVLKRRPISHGYDEKRMTLREYLHLKSILDNFSSYYSKRICFCKKAA
jgi:hypothetical protein